MCVVRAIFLLFSCVCQKKAVPLRQIGAETKMAYTDKKGVVYSSVNCKILMKVPSNIEGEFIVSYQVTDIGHDAFANCDKITSLSFTQKLISIGDSAFKGCNGLTSLLLPYGLKQIGREAFRGCENLLYAIMCDGSVEIEDDAFADCPNLVCIFVPERNISRFKSITNAGISCDTFQTVPPGADIVTACEMATIKALLRRSGIYYLYHFTDARNIDSIKANGGLYSKYALEKRKITEVYRGGNYQSQNCDWENYVYDYVNLSLCEEHPMSYRLRQEGKDVAILKISLDVLDFAEKNSTYKYAGLRFSDKNATSQDAIIEPGIQGFMNIDLEATQDRYLKRIDNPERFALKQAEVLVREFVPLEYIDLDSTIYKEKVLS